MYTHKFTDYFWNWLMHLWGPVCLRNVEQASGLKTQSGVDIVALFFLL
jgi:hypothetical protein